MSKDRNANVMTGMSDAATLMAGQTDDMIDAGMYQLAGIGDFVWNDAN